jgi:WD40 repeat protein
MLVVGDHAGPVNGLAFAPDGRSLVSIAKGGRAVVWDLTGGPPIDGPPESESAMAFAVDPATGAIATADHVARVHLWRPGHEGVRLLGLFDAPVSALSFLAGGSLLAVAIGNRLDAAEPGEVRLLRLSDAREVRRFPESNGAWQVAAAPRHKLLAWSNGIRRVAIVDLSRQDTFVFPALKQSASSLAMSSDRRILAAGDDWAIRLWDPERREETARLTGHKGRILALAFAVDGRTLLSGSDDARVIAWDVADGRVRSEVDWNIGRVTALAVAPDGGIIAAGGDRGRVVMWDFE